MSPDVAIPERLNDAAEARLDDLQARYPNKQAVLLHVLWEIQNQESWISMPWMRYAAKRCEVPMSKVLGVVSFYTMYFTKPPGRYHVQVCRNISCHMMGAPEILERCQKRLGIKNGEITGDGKFSFEEVECMAACSWAPMMAINGAFHENLTPDKVDEILGGLE